MHCEDHPSAAICTASGRVPQLGATSGAFIGSGSWLPDWTPLGLVDYPINVLPVAPPVALGLGAFPVVADRENVLVDAVLCFPPGNFPHEVDVPPVCWLHLA